MVTVAKHQYKQQTLIHPQPSCLSTLEYDGCVVEGAWVGKVGVPVRVRMLRYRACLQLVMQSLRLRTSSGNEDLLVQTLHLSNYPLPPSS